MKKILFRFLFLIGFITVIPYGIWWCITGDNIYDILDEIEAL